MDNARLAKCKFSWCCNHIGTEYMTQLSEDYLAKQGVFRK